MERLRRLRRTFEDDPEFQVKFNKVFTYFWLINMPVVTLIFFFAPGFWNKYSLFYVLFVSLYANFATNYGAVSAAESSDAAHDAAHQ
jgi:hypothetical protein